MAEIKHTFTAGRMNKDLDERLVPNGEYRDASNVQVRTTDGSDAGTVQNIKGNEEIGSIDAYGTSNFKCVGSIADERTDNAYFLVSGGEVSKGDELVDYESLTTTGPDNSWNVANTRITYFTSSAGEQTATSTYSLGANKHYEVEIDVHAVSGSNVSIKCFVGGSDEANETELVSSAGKYKFIVESGAGNTLGCKVTKPSGFGYIQWSFSIKEKPQEIKIIDHIIEQTSEGLTLPVVNDVHNIVESYSNVGSPKVQPNFGYFTVADGSKYRPGMHIKAYNGKRENILKTNAEVVKVVGNNIYLNEGQPVPFVDEKINNSDLSDKGDELVINNNFDTYVSNTAHGILFTDWRVGTADGAFTLSSIDNGFRNTITTAPSSSSVNYTHRLSQYVGDRGLGSSPEFLKVGKFYEVTFEVRSNTSTNIKFQIAKPTSEASTRNIAKTFSTPTSQEWHTATYTFQCIDNDQTQDIQIWDNNNYLRSNGDWIEVRNLSLKQIGQNWTDVNYTNLAIDFPKGSITNSETGEDEEIRRVKLTTANFGSQPTDKIHTDESVINPNTEYTLRYDIESSSGITSLKYWDGDSYTSMNFSNGSHVVNFTSASSVTEAKAYFEAVGTSTSSNVVFNYISIRETNTDVVEFEWQANKILNFDRNNLITGINIIDNLLAWTCGNYEPKRINIDRCKAGTKDFSTHTNLYLNTVDGLQNEADIQTIIYPNLISNGSFNLDTEGWEEKGTADLTRVNGKGRVTIGDGTYNYIASENKIPVEIGEYYELKANVAVGTSDSARISLERVKNREVKYINSLKSSVDTNVSFVFKADTNYITPLFEVFGEEGEYADIDDFYLVKTDKVNGSHNKWGANGGWSLSNNLASNDGSGGTVTLFALTTGVKYTIKVKASSFTSGEFSVFLGSGSQSSRFTGTDEFTYTAVATGDTYARIASYSGVGSFSIADISIVETENIKYTPLVESNVAVLKSSPKSAPKIKLNKNSRDSFSSVQISYNGFVTDEGIPYAKGYNGVFENIISESEDIRIDDILIASSTQVDGSEKFVDLVVTDITTHYETVIDSITGEQSPGDADGINIFYTILRIDSSINSQDKVWSVQLKEKSSGIFQNEFPRFAYRYKYNDNEYSVFSPWSEIAFLPGEFVFNSTEGYNLAMSNTVKKIELSNLNDNNSIPSDVDSIDILYKSTGSPYVMIVKSIHKGVDEDFGDGSVDITTDMVHLTLPDDKILNTWDKVPTKAKSQEVIGNRVVYGNYTQGYDLPFKPSIEQSIVSFATPTPEDPKKSIKSLRSYKTGVVFGDKYGRETPVVSVGSRGDSGSDDTIIPKSSASNRNVIQVKQNWKSDTYSNSKPSDWMDYAKYYVKESGGDYYNLAMDRWYDAEDGNIWISFSSSDINKLTKDSILYLKNINGQNKSIDNDTEYKVLDIKNEAPDFIKYKNSYFGEVNMRSDYFKNDGTGDLDDFKVTLHHLVDADDYSFGMTGTEAPVFKGVGRARAIATTGDKILAVSNMVDISSVKPPGGAEGYHTHGSIHIEKEFGESADFFRILVSKNLYSSIADAEAALNEDGIRIQVFDSIIKNSPEFEGKFFVKIKKDYSIESNVTGSITKIEDYEEDSVIALRYINSSLTSQAVSGDYASYTFGSRDTSGVTNANGIDMGANPFSATNDPDFQFATCAFQSDTSSFWGWYRRVAEEESNKQVGLFIDSATYFDSSSVSDNFGEEYESQRLDENGARWVANKPEGLSTSPSNIEGYDSLSLAVNIPREAEGSSSFRDSSSLSKIKTVGTVFSFGADPNSVKYRVRKVINNNYFNYSVSSTNCNTCTGNVYYGYGQSTTDAKCFRNAFEIHFDRLGNEGQILHNRGVDVNQWDPRGSMRHDGSSASSITVYRSNSITKLDDETISNEPSVWETKVLNGITPDIYYEASNAIPMFLNSKNVRSFIPKNCKVKFYGKAPKADFSTGDIVTEYKEIKPSNKSTSGGSFDIIAKEVTGNAIRLEDTFEGQPWAGGEIVGVHKGDIAIFEHGDGTKTRTEILEYGSISDGVFVSDGDGFKSTSVSYTTSSFDITSVSNYSDLSVGMIIEGLDNHFQRGTKITAINGSTVTIDTKPLINGSNKPVTFHKYSGAFKIDTEVYKYAVDLPWSNCYSFGNGVESNRIRDNFDQPTIDSGVKVSSTYNDISEEVMSSSLIFSGIYNSASSVNNLSEFNDHYDIEKNISPEYGSIQALKSRNSNLNVFTEDKVIKVLANKDALYNADGNMNITSTDKVLGQAIPYVGDYGISKNPESLAHDQYRSYFVDKQRGAVLRLSMDGLTPISNVGMKTWFRENLKNSNELLGSYDIVNGEYNLTIKPSIESQETSKTVSFNEAGKGWVSFKSFIQDSGLSVNGKYLTIKDNKIWEHHSDNVNRNTFYGVYAPSTLTALLNDIPGSIKNFNTLNYEGSEGKSISINNETVTDAVGNSITVNDKSYYLLGGQPSDGYGWSAEIKTDAQSGKVVSFSEKEGKWFSNVVGDQKSFSDVQATDVDEKDFSTQGIGLIKSVSYSGATQVDVKITG